MLGIRTLLFDVDNTLYDAGSGIEGEMNRRINHIVARRLGVTEEESSRLRKKHLARYGTTLRWLQCCHGLKDTGSYMEAVHPEDLGPYIKKNPALRAMLLRLPYRLEILTNGPEFHARRVLTALGINDLFPHIYDVEWLEFEGKPYESAFSRCLTHLGEKAESTLFLDDKEVNLAAFAKLGGQCLLVGPDKGSGDFPRIGQITELENWLTLKQN